ncbi:MAG TPA: response regulator, partial [Labilithrix sp.]|nr:response regulator [Labilithrix sp.]
MQNATTADVVLVVDDEEDIRRLVSFNLTDAGFKVEAVENGTDALAAAARLRPSVVVLDLMLP